MQDESDHNRLTFREKLLLSGSMAFLIAYAIPILFRDPSLETVRVCGSVQAIIWAGFLADLSVRLLRAEGKLVFLRANWLDLLAVCLPILRPLRVLRLASLATLLAHGLGNRVPVRVAVTVRVGATAALLWLIAGLAVTDAERGHGGNIQSALDGWWWALTTMTTVGYGDFYPVTATGRLVGVGLMLLGIAILGITTASMASWFVEKTSQTDSLIQSERAELSDLRNEVVRLRSAISVEPNSCEE